MINVFEQMDRQREQEARDRKAAIEFFGGSRTHKPHLRRGTGHPRPVCPYCKFGERQTVLSMDRRFAIGESIPEYRGNHILVVEEIRVGAGTEPVRTGCVGLSTDVGRRKLCLEIRL